MNDVDIQKLIGRMRAGIMIEDGIEEMIKVIGTLQAEVAHWKANHADIVKRAALLAERPDLPVDRIPAYREMGRLQDILRAVELYEARQRIADLLANEGFYEKLWKDHVSLQSGDVKILYQEAEEGRRLKLTRASHAEWSTDLQKRLVELSKDADEAAALLMCEAASLLETVLGFTP